MHRQQILGGATVLAALTVLLLVTFAVARHPASIQGPESGLLWLDVALLLLYASAGVWTWCQSRREVNVSLSAGTKVGVLLAAVLIANHVIESFVLNRSFVLVIVPVLLMLVLFGAAGSLAWERTRSLMLAVIGGVWCAIIAILISLSFAFCFNLTFETRAQLQLHEAFVASGMNESGAFLVKNMLKAASEGLVRMPIFAALLSFTGGFMHAWIGGRSRPTALAVSCLAPLLFVAGVAALKHADLLERAARPPFVISGVLLAGVPLCAAYPIWSVLHASRGRSGGAVERPASVAER